MTREEVIAIASADLDRAGSSYRVRTNGPFVHIRDLRVPQAVTLSLERDVYLERDLVVPAQEAVFTHVVKAIAGREPEGIVGTGSIPGPECPLSRPVRLAQGSSTVEAFLDEIAKQVPGLVWLVTYNEEEANFGLKVGFVCGDGATVKLTVFP